MTPQQIIDRIVSFEKDLADLYEDLHIIQENKRLIHTGAALPSDKDR